MDYAKALKEFGCKVKKHRDTRGVREVAKSIGISPATLSRVERGYNSDFVTIHKVCTWLEVGIDSIFDNARGPSVPRVRR